MLNTFPYGRSPGNAFSYHSEHVFKETMSRNSTYANSNFYLNFALFQANNFIYLRSVVQYTIEKNIKLIFKESHNGV
jgi:hypothetical protein